MRCLPTLASACVSEVDAARPNPTLFLMTCKEELVNMPHVNSDVMCVAYLFEHVPCTIAFIL